MVYCVATLAFVATAQDIRVRCLLTNKAEATGLAGLEVRSTEGLGTARSIEPIPGDLLISLGGHRVHSFVDYSTALDELRRRPITSAETLVEGSNPSELSEFQSSSISLVKLEPGPRLAKAVFERDGETFSTWLPMQAQSATGITISIVWLVLQLGVVLVAGLAHWRRPYDRPLRLFFITAFVAMAAFIGGSHWWVICSTTLLLVPFSVCAILLPALLLHFFLLYPVPRRWLVQRTGWVLAAVYTVPVLSAVGAVAAIVAGARLSGGYVDGPLGAAFEALAAGWTMWLLTSLRDGILAYLAVAAIYFLLSVALLVYAFLRSRQRTEHEQVRWILAAAGDRSRSTRLCTVDGLRTPGRISLRRRSRCRCSPRACCLWSRIRSESCGTG